MKHGPPKESGRRGEREKWGKECFPRLPLSPFLPFASLITCSATRAFAFPRTRAHLLARLRSSSTHVDKDSRLLSELIQNYFDCPDQGPRGSSPATTPTAPAVCPARFPFSAPGRRRERRNSPGLTARLRRRRSGRR